MGWSTPPPPQGPPSTPRERPSSRSSRSSRPSRPWVKTVERSRRTKKHSFRVWMMQMILKTIKLHQIRPLSSPLSSNSQSKFQPKWSKNPKLNWCLSLRSPLWISPAAATTTARRWRPAVPWIHGGWTMGFQPKSHYFFHQIPGKHGCLWLLSVVSHRIWCKGCKIIWMCHDVPVRPIHWTSLYRFWLIGRSLIYPLVDF